MDDVAVDIVVNNHNYARFLGTAIDSALAQDHPRTRVIVVDDGSTDDSRAILAGYGDRVEAIVKRRGGQASAFNAGFAASSGDVVIFLDADDALLPSAAARVAEVVRRNPDVAKVQYRLAVVDAEGRPTGGVKPPPGTPLPSGDLRRHELAFPFDLTWVATSGNAIAASVLREILPMPEEEFTLGADWYVLHLAPLFGEVESLDEICGLYRVHGGNGYQQALPRLDLVHVRQSIVYAHRAGSHIEAAAGRLGLAAPDGVRSVSDLGNRLVSLKLEPTAHPLRDDSRRRVAVAGVRASWSRFDLSHAMRVLLMAWFLLLWTAPRRLARPLSELFLYPERRGPLARLLEALRGR